MGIIWEPGAERASASALSTFARIVSESQGRDLSDYRALHRWSVEEMEAFWSEVWSFCDVIGERGERVLERRGEMPAAKFFPDASLCFAENLLRRRDASPALIFRNEGGERREVSFSELHDSVAHMAAFLRARGVEKGDRVAAYLPNIPEAVIAMLATSSIGAIFSSCSPDFGVAGVIDRFAQIECKILLCVDGYSYQGKAIDILSRIQEIRKAIPSIQHCILIPYLDPDNARLPDSTPWTEVLATKSDGEILFERLPFDHPLYIVYSSGTTGKPKCIVHGAGGTLLQHLKEHRLHVDLGSDDRLFYFTTCGWMMWNWLVSGLASEASLLLYDGSPTYPQRDSLFEIAEEEGVHVFGTSAKFIDACAKAGLSPGRQFDLSRIRTLLSTGSPLLPEAFDYVYREIGSDIHLASISGGTDLLSCFILGVPTLPVRRGEIQGAGLGMKVEVLDGSGRRIRGKAGELSCSRAFPSMPVGFWKDPGNERYRAAYFERYPNVWHHGDWCEERPSGGYVIHGRSDAVLNPGGVRIGTAEIYRQVETIHEVEEALVIGQRWHGDTRIILFVKLRREFELDEDLKKRIRSRIRKNATPRHQPAKILQVGDIPRTRSGKITELAVNHVVHGREVKNREALANPEALELFRDLPELAI
jgi:acetoacetyl-CoA synthetase